MKKSILFLCINLIISPLMAQDLLLYEKHIFIHNTDTLPYRLLLPENYTPGENYPLLLLLHGAGERGNDNEKQLVHGASLFVRPDVRHHFPAIILLPQCPVSDYWSNVVINRDEVTNKRTFHFQTGGAPTRAMSNAISLLHEIINNYPVDTNRIYAGGISMGGMGTFEIVRRNPTLFAAAFPLCGGANPETAKELTHTAWWIFHGAKDDVVPLAHSQSMVIALQALNVNVGFTLYPHANHNCWDATFAEPQLLPWLFAQKKD